MSKDSKHIDERMLILHLLDEISDAGRREVEHWLSLSDENRRQYDELRRTWDETGKLGSTSVDFDVDKAWQRLSKSLGREAVIEVPAIEPGKVRNTKMLRWITAAAAVVIFVMATFLVINRQKGINDQEPLILTSFETVLADTLPDGSSVLLNTNSTLSSPASFATNERKVELQGEAFFEVEHDGTKPFVIGAGLGEIRVLGTSFQVKAYPSSDLEVFVEKGRVELSSFDTTGIIAASVVLSAGERGIIRYPGREIIAGNDLRPDDLFWVNRKLIFEETKLSLVFDLLKKHYDTEIMVMSDDILECRLSATFNNETEEQILTVIAATFNLSVEHKNDLFIITGKGCQYE